MDFTKFINSKDIREYHRKIGYEYNSVEAACLVSRSFNATLKEKHEAWQWILDNMPDLKVKHKMIIPLDKTLHEYINAYMEMQNTYIREMKEGGKNTVYFLEFLYDSDDVRNNDNYKAVFPKWDS